MARKKIDVRREAIAQHRIRQNYERKLYAQLNRLHKRIGEQVGASVAESGVIPNGIVGKGYNRVLMAHYRAVITEFATYTYEQIKYGRKADTDFEDLIQYYMQEQGATAIKNISDTTREKIRATVSEGATEGLGNVEIAKNVRALMGGKATRARAGTIARTETHSAANFANHDMANTLAEDNFTLRKRWVAVKDDRTRSTHARMDGVEIDYYEPFKVANNRRVSEVDMDYPGDPKGGAANVINCRCVVIYVEPGDEVIHDNEGRFAPVNEDEVDDVFLGEYSLAQEDALEAYSGTSYSAINSIMRGDVSDFTDAIVKKQGKNAKEILGALEGTFTTRDIKVFRGDVMEIDRFDELKNALKNKKNLKINNTQSTSINARTPQDFMSIVGNPENVRPVFSEYEVPKGSPAVWMEHAGAAAGNEAEVLLAPGNLRVKSIKRVKYAEFKRMFPDVDDELNLQSDDIWIARVEVVDSDLSQDVIDKVLND